MTPAAARRRIAMRAAAALLGASCAACSGSSDAPEGTAIASFAYGAAPRPGSCSAAGKPGKAGPTDGLKSRDGIPYTVRAPANLDPTRAHPLLVVYAPAGHSAQRNETLTRLTTEATGRGFIVAYAASRPMSVRTVSQMARIPEEIAGAWCIDPDRVYATGHSDGGTVSTALPLLPETKGVVSAIAPSAAGFSRKDLEAFQCPQPVPVMIMHGKRDTHFPGWGKEAARWWARCNACDIGEPPAPRGGGCAAFLGCAPGGATLYCEGGGAHADWPPMGGEILRFLEASGTAQGQR